MAVEQQNKQYSDHELYELLSQHPAEVENVSGIRTVYFNPHLKSDHSDQHNEHWNKAIGSGCLEAGTITKVVSDFENHTATATVCWDCGVVKTYTPDLWEYLRVYSLGPAGRPLNSLTMMHSCVTDSEIDWLSTCKSTI